MKKIKVVLHQPLNIFTLVKSLLTITILEEVVAQYELIDLYPSLERTHTLEKLIKANKDNVYASDVKLDLTKVKMFRGWCNTTFIFFIFS